MNLKKLTLIGSMILSTGLFAGVQEIKTLKPSESGIHVAEVQASFNLQKPTNTNQTRINLVVKDLGGSSDVSPHMGLYLTFWKDGEWGNATAAFEIDSAFSLVDYSQQSDGTLVLQLKEMSDQGAFYVKKVTVNYSEFAAKFEKESANYYNNEAINLWVKGSIYTKTAQ